MVSPLMWPCTARNSIACAMSIGSATFAEERALERRLLALVRPRVRPRRRDEARRDGR
jgi:hypothetical protein